MSASFVKAFQNASKGSSPSVPKTLIKRNALTTVSALKNGMRVACETTTGQKSATVGLWIDNGSRYEANHLRGASRLLLKCGLFGTQTFTTAQLNSAVDELGGTIVPSVGREHTYIYITTSKDQVLKAAGVLSEVARNARLSNADLVKAKQEVLNDLLAEDKCTNHRIVSNLMDCAYGKLADDMPTASMAVQHGVKHIKVDDLEHFRQSFTCPNRAVLVGFGDVDHSLLEEAANTHFGDWCQGHAHHSSVDTFVGGESRENSRSAEGAAWGVETCGASSSDTIPLALACLKTQLHFNGSGSGFATSSLPTVVHPFMHSFRDGGACGFCILPTSKAAQSALADSLQRTVTEWRQLSLNVANPDEIEKAKFALKRRLLLTVDGAHNSVLDIGRQVLQIGRRVPLPEMFRRIDNVTSKDVSTAVHHYFLRRKPVFSYLGGAYPPYSRTKKWTNRFWN